MNISLSPNAYLLVLSVLATIVFWYISLEIRHYLRKLRSSDWPTVPGTVQKSGEILDSPVYFGARLPRILFGYRYSVSGQTFFGYFVLIVEDKNSASRLEALADGHSVTVRYNPRNPEISVLADRELLTRRVSQYPELFKSESGGWRILTPQRRL